MEKIDNIFFTSMMPPYGANTGVLHQSVGLGSSLDGENTYPDFLSHSSAPEFLL
jgi:hypothetical protein